MSRIGKKPIAIPKGTTVSWQDGLVTVKGPKGQLQRQVVMPHVLLELQDDKLQVTRKDDSKTSRSLHGLTRTLISNMVDGVNSGFTKSLELIGVGYKAAIKGRSVVLNVGYSHPVEIEAPPGVDIAIEGPTKVVVNGIDKELVGNVAASIRAVRKPEPYKGKGIRYSGEHVRKKVGKAK